MSCSTTYLQQDRFLEDAFSSSGLYIFLRLTMPGSRLVQVARVPISENSLVSPYKLFDDQAIHAAEDFTVRITTISQQLYTKYKQDYKAGQFNNDYFVLLSQTGLGNESKPNLRLNYVEHIGSIEQDILNLWAENIRAVEDYRDQKQGEGGKAGRLYLSFHSYCQGIGSSSLDDIKNVGAEIIHLTGLFAPILAPYTAAASVALKGIGSIIDKFMRRRFQSERKSAGINLYPFLDDGFLPSGDAYLHTGSYIMFFEPTDITGLSLDESGIVISSNSQPVNPYIVVNITKGITLAPDQLDIGVTQEILEKYQSNYGYPLPESQQNNGYVDGLKQLGESYRWVKKIERYYQLKKKGADRKPAEISKMDELAKEIKEQFPDLEL